MVRWALLMALMAAAPAQGASVSPFRLYPVRAVTSIADAPAPKRTDRLDPLDGEEFQGLARPDRVLGEALPIAATPATAVAFAVRGLRRQPPPLQVEAMAGHNAFEAARRQRALVGWRVAPHNSALGVGLTGSYGVPLTARLTATPFVSLDYLRADSARFANLRSPFAYVPDNANIGMAVTAGASLAWRFGPSRRFKLTGYGAVVAASGAEESQAEFASVGARVIQSLGETRFATPYADIGAGLSYAAAPRVRFSGAVVQTIGHDGTDQTALRVAVRMRY